jgi:hypothetical protein
MTEAEWLTATNPLKQLMYVRRTSPTLRTAEGRRKFRLFAVGCTRRIWPAMRQDAQCRAVEVAEQFADGEGTTDDLWSAWTAARISFPDTTRSTPLLDLLFSLCHPETWEAVKVWRRTSSAEFDAVRGNKPAAEKRQLGSLVRCIFGNPFRPVTFDPAWRTSDVLLLARGIYEERAFDRMPILADALQDAGCNSADILDHCRDANTFSAGEPPTGSPVAPSCHARGCWVVDLVLGKS